MCCKAMGSMSCQCMLCNQYLGPCGQVSYHVDLAMQLCCFTHVLMCWGGWHKLGVHTMSLVEAIWRLANGQ